MSKASYYSTHKPAVKASCHKYYMEHQQEAKAYGIEYYNNHKEFINKRRTLNVYRSIFPHDVITKKVEEVGLVAACAHFRVKRAELRKQQIKDKTKTQSPAAEIIKLTILSLKKQLKGL
jgi:hypothetical protein